MQVPEELADEAPTTKLVYLSLEHETSPMSQHQIASQTDLHVRQVRSALSVLDEHGLLEERQNLHDLRKKHYEVTKDTPG